MSNSRFERTLYARVAGDIWMPQTLCWKDVKLTDSRSPFSDFRYSDGSKPSLRDMVLQAMNDGDFQSCGLVEGTVVIRYRRKDRTIEKRVELTPETRTIEDCWASDAVCEQVMFADCGE